VGSFTKEQAANTPPYPAASGESVGGYELFVIEYVGAGGAGAPVPMSALVYAPSGGASAVPVVALGHGTLGVGPRCGPSHVPALTDPLAVPLVGRGYAVVAPDFGGNGVDTGMSSYLVGRAEGAAMLDAVRALDELHDPRFDARQLGSELFVAGHSQGGHAALFAHQLYDGNMRVHLLGSIALAPGLGSARQWSTLFADPARPFGFMEAFGLASLHSHMLSAGGPDASAWLRPAGQAMVQGVLHDECLPAIALGLPAKHATVGDVYRPAFLDAAKACSFDGPCPAFEPWASELVADEPGRFTSSVPSLVLEGTSDVLVPPSSVACIVERMQASKTPVQACGYAGADHACIVAAAEADMLRWMAARRQGATPDVCAAPLSAACGAP
jgi:pimeloyl-ACP methyl ester carboxylesterase